MFAYFIINSVHIRSLKVHQQIFEIFDSFYSVINRQPSLHHCIFKFYVNNNQRQSFLSSYFFCRKSLLERIKLLTKMLFEVFFCIEIARLNHFDVIGVFDKSGLEVELVKLLASPQQFLRRNQLHLSFLVIKIEDIKQRHHPSISLEKRTFTNQKYALGQVPVIIPPCFLF